MRNAFLGFVAALLRLAAPTLAAENATIVDLGYAVHQGNLNTAYNYYTFKNIRYAEPLTPELRWKPPDPPVTTNRTFNNGTESRICPQSYPHWILEPRAAAVGLSAEQLSAFLMLDARMNEDCLFLDVHVPADIWEGRRRPDAGAAVMVWIHGGGYTIGAKDQDPFDPSGLIARSQLDDQEGIIYVSINYRLGMFGFLPGDGDDAVSNVGFWDQRLALEWVQARIRAFGGDPARVTVFGESAGGSSIMHQITAFGGRGKAPFSAAIAQSPAIRTTTDDADVWSATLRAASEVAGESIESAQQLRGLNSSVLIKINQATVFNSSYGLFTYGPTVDGTFVPEIAGVSLLNGRFDDSINVMVAHNSNESGLFLPSISTSEELVSLFRASYPVTEEAEEIVFNDLYPDVLDGSFGYTTQQGRAELLVSELVFTCNTRFLGTAFGNRTFNYRFEYPPGSHGQDLDWTFFVQESQTVDPELAVAMQRYFVQFAMFGDPNGAQPREGLPAWPRYGDQAQLALFGAEGVGFGLDETANRRCAYWQKGDYLLPWR